MTNQYHNDDHPASIYAIDNPVVAHTNANLCTLRTSTRRPSPHPFLTQPTLPQSPDAERIVPLCQTHSRLIAHQIAMVELPRVQAQQAIEEKLTRG
jgi:hypothetical protein